MEVEGGDEQGPLFQ
jgi:peptidyl-tRNA hydrolase